MKYACTYSTMNISVIFFFVYLLSETFFSSCHDIVCLLEPLNTSREFFYYHFSSIFSCHKITTAFGTWIWINQSIIQFISQNLMVIGSSEFCTLLNQKFPKKIVLNGNDELVLVILSWRKLLVFFGKLYD